MSKTSLESHTSLTCGVMHLLLWGGQSLIHQMCQLSVSTIVWRIGILFVLQIEVLGVLACNIILYFFRDNMTILWVFCTALGFFTGPIIPSAYAWANRYIEVMCQEFVYVYCVYIRSDFSVDMQVHVHLFAVDEKKNIYIYKMVSTFWVCHSDTWTISHT